MSNDQGPKVGYKCPPKHTQFQKGRSGNPRGRPKKVTEEKHPGDIQLRDDFLGLAVQDIKVTLNGKQKTMTAMEGIYQKQLLKALAGDTRAAEFCDKRYASYMLQEGKSIVELLETYWRVEASLKSQIDNAQSMQVREEKKKAYEDFKKSEEVRFLFERMRSPIKKFKP